MEKFKQFYRTLGKRQILINELEDMRKGNFKKKIESDFFPIYNCKTIGELKTLLNEKYPRCDNMQINWNITEDGEFYPFIYEEVELDEADKKLIMGDLKNTVQGMILNQLD